MANQTITTNTNFDTLTGLLAGEMTTITNGARLTIDSDPQVNRVLPGDIVITEGECHIDGTRVRELSFTGASSLPVVGDTLTAGGVTGQVIGVAGTAASGSIRLRSLSGAISTGTALSFTGGKSATAAGSDRIGWLRILGAETRGFITTRQGRLRITGEWYLLGVSSGAASQTFQHYTTDVVPAIWVETGANTGIYEIWLNAGTRWSASIDTGERGKFFSMTNGNATITFGNGTNGTIPPNGARIRVPNIHLGSALTTAPTTGTINGTIASRYDTTTTSSGEILIDRCLGSGFFLSINQAFSTQITDSGFLQTVSISEVTSSCVLQRVGVGINAGVTAQSLILGTLRSLILEDVSAAAFAGATNGSALSLTDAQNVTITRGRYSYFARANTLHDTIECVRVINLTMTDVISIGGFVDLAGVSNSTITNLITSDMARGADSTANGVPSLFVGADCNNLTINGVSILPGGTRPRNAIVALSAAQNIRIRNIGAPANPINLTGQTGVIVDVQNNNSNIEIARCYATNTRVGAKSDANASSNVRYMNVWGDAADVLTNNALNARYSGILSGNNQLGAAGIVTSLTAVYGSHFYDCFFSGTTGCVGVHMNEKTSVEPSASSYEIIAGTPVFNASGTLRMRTAGDQIIWTMPWFVLGHTGFANSPIVFSGTNAGNHTFQYQLDTGSGFGAWKTIVGANLSAESISPTTGFRLRILVTCTTSSSTNAINGFYISTITTATARETLYPLDLIEANLTLSGLQPNSEVRIYRAADSVELAGVENSGTSFTYPYTWAGTDIEIVVVVHSLGFEYLRITGVSLTQSGVTIPVQQRRDRSYLNP